MQGEIAVSTAGPGFYELTDRLAAAVAQSGIRSGLISLFIRHTSASLVIQENADADVRADLETFFAKLVPRDMGAYRHTVEGPDDMPAHIRAALTQTDLSIPVVDGRPGLGTWQGVFVYEHRDAPQYRRVIWTVVGD